MSTAGQLCRSCKITEIWTSPFCVLPSCPLWSKLAEFLLVQSHLLALTSEEMADTADCICDALLSFLYQFIAHSHILAILSRTCFLVFCDMNRREFSTSLSSIFFWFCFVLCFVLLNKSFFNLSLLSQALLSVGLYRQEHYNGLPFPFPRGLPDPWI